MMNAQFLAIVNIIVYAGAIMVLFLFVLMLLNLNKATEPKTPLLVMLSSVMAAGVFVLVLVAALKDSFIQKTGQVAGNLNAGMVENLGELLFKKYIVPFEISSILFIASMVGAVLLAKREKPIID
jgi:NADH-quinone oxidoreductase subunit J